MSSMELGLVLDLGCFSWLKKFVFRTVHMAYWVVVDTPDQELINTRSCDELAQIRRIFLIGYGALDLIHHDLMEVGMRDEAFLHMLCVFNGFLDVSFKSVKLVKFLVNLVSSYEWLGLSTQLTPREKVKALCANGEVSGSRVRVVWMVVDGGNMGELSLEKMSMKSVQGIFFGGFWVENLALDAMEYDDQDK
ncbi:hypothetical protein Tco_0140729 [Tanacetum coccineum]